MSDYYNSTEELPLFAPPPPPVGAPNGKTFFGTAEENKRHILAALKEQILPCRDVDRLTSSRGQALIGELRKEGHKIHTICRDGQNCYEYIGLKGDRIRVPKSVQEAYYQTAHWRSKARQRKEIDGYKCQQCGGCDFLETHHWVYRLFDEDVERELITFCRDCHAAVHEWIKGGGCHFPRTVDARVASLLGWNHESQSWESPNGSQARHRCST